MTSSDGPAAVRIRDLRKVHGTGEGAVAALDGVTLDIPPGTFTAIMGPSGSGKSTLLHCAAGLDEPTSGGVEVAGCDLGALSENGRTLMRRDRIGFVFQAFNLVASLTAAQNVELPARFARRRTDPADTAAALAEVGLGDRAGHRPAQLSGGQQQRVAIARALLHDPEVVFADEPTGALDTATSQQVMGLLRDLVDRTNSPRRSPRPAHSPRRSARPAPSPRRSARPGGTVVMVTHDPAVAAWADVVVFLADGRVVDQLPVDASRRAASSIATRMAQLETR